MSNLITDLLIGAHVEGATSIAVLVNNTSGLIQVMGSFVGQVLFEGSEDESVWSSLKMLPCRMNYTELETKATQAGVWELLEKPVWLRVRLVSYVSGYVNVQFISQSVVGSEPARLNSLLEGGLETGDAEAVSANLASPASNKGATLVGYRLSETGAAARTVQARLGDFVVATDFIGVDPTGVTDSSAGLQAAIDALPAEGGTVYVPEGTYNINSGAINIQRSNVSLVGAGWGATSFIYTTLGHGIVVQALVSGPEVNKVTISGFRIRSTATGDTDVAGRGAILLDGGNAGVADILVQGVLIDGCGTSGMVVSGRRIVIDQCIIKDCGEHAIYMSNARETLISGCVFENWNAAPSEHDGGNGIKMTGAVRDTTVTGCWLHSPGSHANAILVGAQCVGVIAITGCLVEIAGDNQIAFRLGSGAAVVSACAVNGGTGYSNSQAVELIYGSGMQVLGLAVRGAWQSSPILFRPSASYAVVRDVIIEAGPSGGYAIDLLGAVSPTVEDCTILSGTHGINLGTSSGARIRNNRLVVSVNAYETSGPLTDFQIEDSGSGRVVVSADYSISVADRYLAVDTGTARGIYLLPAASYPVNQQLIIKDETGGAAAHNITINRAGSDTIDGATSKVISTNYGSLTLVSTGTGWAVV